MNIILFEKDEIGKPIPFSDDRARHILNILKIKQGESFDAGIVNTGTGKGRVEKIESDKILFRYESRETTLHRNPVSLLTAVTRPIDAKKILKNCATIGIAELFIVLLDKTEKSYMESSLWKSNNYRQFLVSGAEQAFASDIPDLHLFDSLDKCLEKLPARYKTRIALDNYEAESSLGSVKIEKNNGGPPQIILAVGGERGWSGRERELLRNNRFTLCSLGRRVLKTETACIAALSVILGKSGLL